MFLDVLARFKHTSLVVDGPNTIQTEMRSESWPALAHTRWLCAVAYVEELTASALFGAQRRPDTESRDDVGEGFVGERFVCGGCAGEGDSGAWSFDVGVEGEVGGLVGCETEGAAVGCEADDGIGPDFAPCPCS